MFRNILVAVDGSLDADQALTQAAEAHFAQRSSEASATTRSVTVPFRS